MAAETKQQSFHITSEQQAEIEWLRDAIGASSTEEAMLRAVRVMALLARETQQGRVLYAGDDGGTMTRLTIPELDPPAENWKYLEARPHPWRRQLFLKGRRLRAFTVWMDMLANEMTPEEAADNWDLPLEAVEEVIRYCESHRELLGNEADEERRYLEERGYRLEPPPTRG